MSPLPGLAIYQPHRLNPDTFLAGFVARTDLADSLLEKLRMAPADGVADHQLIVGQRGMGKTSLLRRLAIGIARDEALSRRYIPLTFREEQYNVRSLARLWRNCAESLAEWCEAQGKTAIAAELDRAMAKPEWHDPRAAAEAFLATAKSLGGRPVLFIDNLDLILDALPPDEHWGLRHTLQAPGGPILYGAATQLIRQSGDRGGAFYEFFYPHLLHPLSEAELMRCLRKIADTRGPAGQPVRDILAREPERLRTLHTLTGGNPRVLALVYQLLERAESDTVFADLEVLLDQLTPFYKARVEDYRSDLQRAVIDAVALHWDPITSHDLAKTTDVEITTISSQLTRLKNDGLIEEVPTSGARAGYQLVERFFNIWYLMRHGTRRTRQRMCWLTAFLRSFYAPDELKRMKLEAVGLEQTGWHPLYLEALFAAVDSLAPLTQIKMLGISITEPPIESQLGPNVGALCTADIEINEATELITKKAVQLRTLGRYEEAIMVYDDVVARFQTETNPVVQVVVAGALIHKGIVLGTLSRSAETIGAYDEIVTQFQTETNTALQIMVGVALLCKLISLRTLDRSNEAIALSDEIVARFGVSTELAFRLLVGSALVDKGYHLGKLGHSREAITIYDEVVSRFDSAPEPALCEQVAQALFNKGVTTATLGNSEEVIAIYDDIVARFGSATEPVIREQIAKALVNKGVALAVLGRSEEAIAVCNEVKARFEAATEPSLREQLALALMNKGSLTNTVGRSDEALAVYDEVVTIFSTAPGSALRAAVAKSLLAKSVINNTLGRADEAIAAIKDIVAMFEGAPEVSIREFLAMALAGESVILESLARVEDALVAVQRAIQIEPDNGFVLVALGNLLADQFGQFKEAETAYLQAMRDVKHELLAKSNLGWLYVTLGRISEASELRSGLETFDPVGLALFDAALELAADNLGAATEHLSAALDGDQKALTTNFFDDLLRLLRLAKARGFGEKLIAWLEETRHAERYAPVYAAFVAYMRGEKFLRDVSPEVRGAAEKIYRRLVGHVASQAADPKPARKPQQRRGRRASR